MKRIANVLLVSVVLTALAAEAAIDAPAATATTPTAVNCTKKWEVIGKKVAVRLPRGDAHVASPDSPVVRYLHRGDVVTSCVEAIARTQSGPAYHKCGRGGHVWRIVRGGQVPATCLKRL
ncbi:hypothetical protein [Streptomyces rochei]|uniref:hypothetical protein n=1 Tax=Streptomyces rochei TaxID=1928 RepID=UPI0033BA8AF7